MLSGGLPTNLEGRLITPILQISQLVYDLLAEDFRSSDLGLDYGSVSKSSFIFVVLLFLFSLLNPLLYILSLLIEFVSDLLHKKYDQ